MVIQCAITYFIIASCQTQDSKPDSPADDEQTTVWQQKLDSAEVDDSAVRSSDGSVILHIDDIPGNIRVTQDSEFGASERILEFSAAPDYEWYAVITSGAAHSAGWLVRTETAELVPASFQYGGGLTAGSWSVNGQYLFFVHEGPAGDRTLSVANRSGRGDTVEENSVSVEIPGHDDMLPEDRIYETLRWENNRLHFTTAGDSWIFDAETGTVLEGD